MRPSDHQWILRFLLVLNNDVLLLTWGVVDLDVYVLLMNARLDLVLLYLGLMHVRLLLDLLLKVGLSILELLILQLF